MHIIGKGVLISFISILLGGCGCFAPVSDLDLVGTWRLTQERWEGDLIPARTMKIYDIHDAQIALQDAALATAYQLSKHLTGTQLTVQSPRTIELLDPIYDDEPMTFRVAIKGTAMTWYMGVIPMEMYVFEREEEP
ncbi:MAG TPA: hypothetical protein PLI09_14405 [Candidatus Hydrogenedentes bacterium]|nr:hypothetical protein [Candidatus Hydrogenedentota bacterium]